MRTNYKGVESKKLKVTGQVLCYKNARSESTKGALDCCFIAEIGASLAPHPLSLSKEGSVTWL